MDIDIYRNKPKCVQSLPRNMIKKKMYLLLSVTRIVNLANQLKIILFGKIVSSLKSLSVSVFSHQRS